VSGEDPSRAAADEAWARAADAGIHRLAVPTPFLVGRVNCYLIEDEPLTLVDTGPNSGKSLDELVRALERRGHTLQDLGLIVITHQHMDHLGLLEIVARRADAEVAALHLLAPYLEHFSQRAAEDDEFAQSIMRRHGVPEDLITVLGSVGAAFRAFGSSGHVSRELFEGDVLTFRDRTLRVLHRPGHSPSDTLFWDEDRRILIAGDHLLDHVSSNPLISRPLTTEGVSAPRRRALIEYIESMRATRTLPAELVVTGHGDPITDHVSLIDERLRMHDRRARKMLGLLADGPLTAFEVATAMWGNIAVTQAFLTLSEVVGHMDVLAAEGKVRELEQADVVRFEATPGPQQAASGAED
jgi:glyoxylase-like metal-dependent hydrolase (beta-lactamase superfamily II)